MTNYIGDNIGFISDRTRFGGLIYFSDFDTNPGAGTKNMADRIARDLRFDEQCRKNIEARDRFKTQKNNEV